MQSLVPAFQIEILIGILCGVVILFWQVRAYYRYQRNFFATLATSTVLGMAWSLMTAIPYFFRISENQTVTLYWLAIPLAIMSMILGAWGSVQLFQALDDMQR